tara:strand:- start:13 stop:288 length:276 start_codon:yes stop_codon:yes gene_type:complete
MEAISILLGLVGIIVGGIITFSVSKNYYERASADLMEETARLRKLNTLALKALEEGGLVRFNRNSSGEIVGLVYEVSINETIKTSASFEST